MISIRIVVDEREPRTVRGSVRLGTREGLRRDEVTPLSNPRSVNVPAGFPRRSLAYYGILRWA